MTTSPPSPTPTSWRHHPGQSIGGYRLVRPLGRGGAGEVFEAEHERIGQTVALKVLCNPTQAPYDRARFLNEARILARLRHPGIVTIYACNETATGEVFIAMEYLEGASLRGHLRSLMSPMPLPRVIAIALQIADAMAYAHQHGVTHRDLKPENIMLYTDLHAADGYRTKVVDFGTAKAPPLATEPDTQMDTPRISLLGTPQYMAPEQCLGTDDVSGQIDVYALAVILFELLTGRPPFFSSSGVELLTLHRNAPPPSLREYVPAAPPGLCQLLDKMLHKVPAERPTMSEVAQQLRVLAARQSTRGRDPTPRPDLITRRGFGLGLVILPVLIWGTNSWRREQARSEERLNSFLDTAEELISSSDWKLAQRAGTASIRLDTLRQLATKLEQLRKPERPNWRIERLAIRCQYRLGDLAIVYEPLGSARRAYQTGSALTSKLQRWAPDQDEAKQLLSTALTKQGDVARQEGKQDVAKQRYAEAALIQEDLLQRNPGNLEYLRLLAISYDGRADVLLEEEDEQSARALYDKALEILGQRAVRAQDAYQQYLEALVIYRLGEAARWRKDETSAEEEYTRAMTLMRAVVAAQPQPTLYRVLLGQLNERMGELCTQNGQLAEARSFTAQALALARALTDSDPDHKRYALLLVQCLHLASSLAEAERDLTAARSFEKEAQQLRRRFADDVENSMWQRELLVGYISLSKIAADELTAKHHVAQAEALLRSFISEGRWSKDQQVRSAMQKVRQISQPKTSL